MSTVERKCPECGKTISSDVALTTHRKNAHGITPLEESNRPTDFQVRFRTIAAGLMASVVVSGIVLMVMGHLNLGLSTFLMGLFFLLMTLFAGDTEDTGPQD